MKKNGFTLIELLAVIVILAIIALIATPLVLKYIETSRIESFKVSVENIKDAALKYVASEQLNGKVTYPVTVDVQDLDFKGKEGYTGKVRVLKNGVVEEFVETDNYRSGNGGFINKKTEPYLKVKEGKTATIDDKNGYVYSFFNNENASDDYTSIVLSEDILNNIFDTTIGNITYEKSPIRGGAYSTGAKIIISDDNGNVLKEYQIVIFGDIVGQGKINSGSVTKINGYFDDPSYFTELELKAADLNRDGIVDNLDKNLIMDILIGTKKYNQFTNKLEQK